MDERSEQLHLLFDMGVNHGYKACDEKIARKTAELNGNDDAVLAQAYISGVDSGVQMRKTELMLEAAKLAKQDDSF